MLQSFAALDGIPKTLLIPLYFRAREGLEANPLVRDADAERLVQASRVDFSGLDRGLSNRMSRAGTVNRTLLIDASVRRFMTDWPGATVVNVGCGLDARFRRLDDGRVHWIDADVEEVITLRREVLPESSPRHATRVGSLLTRDWMRHLPFATHGPVMLICEGTLMYFTEEQASGFLCRAVDTLPVERMCLEVVGPWLQDRVHPSVRAMGLDALPMRWGSRDFEAVAGWHARLRLERARTVFDINPERFGPPGWILRLAPRLRTGLGSSIVDLSVEAWRSVS